jgi:hypothetical protein
MSSIHGPSFVTGKYLITPMSRTADNGSFTASVSIRSGQGSGTHDRIYSFAPEFMVRENALLHAATQGRNLLVSSRAFG